MNRKSLLRIIMFLLLNTILLFNANIEKSERFKINANKMILSNNPGCIDIWDII